MASLLDFTLIVQLVHFLIAYWILTKLFLAPAYAFIMGKRQENELIESGIKEQETLIALQDLEKRDQLIALQKKILLFFTEKHKTQSFHWAGVRDSSRPQQVSSEMKNKIVKNISTNIIQRILHEK